jgi:hypothetical protein
MSGASILDRYFKYPVLWDIAIASSLTLVVDLLLRRRTIVAQELTVVSGWIGDMANAGLTSAGFILTCLTILVTFKSTLARPSTAEDSTFNQFFDSSLYHKTITIMKWCVYSVLLVSCGCYFLRLLVQDSSSLLVKYFAFGAVVLLLSLWRCVLVLGMVLRLQRGEHS